MTGVSGLGLQVLGLKFGVQGAFRADRPKYCLRFWDKTLWHVYEVQGAKLSAQASRAELSRAGSSLVEMFGSFQKLGKSLLRSH